MMMNSSTYLLTALYASALFLLCGCNIVRETNPIVDINGSWFGKCYSEFPCEIYFDNEILMFTSDKSGSVIRNIKWIENDKFYVKQDSLYGIATIQNKKLEIVFLNPSIDTFLLERSKIKYHPIDKFCSEKKTLECSCCQETATMTRWFILKDAFKNEKDIEEYLNAETQHYKKLNDPFSLQCWQEIKNFYFKE